MAKPARKNVILGTVQFGLHYGINNQAGKPDADTVFEILRFASDSGISSLDTAAAYGNASELIGAFHQQSPLHFNVNTKFTGLSGEQIYAEIKSYLQVLQIDQIQTLFFHSFQDYTNRKGLLEKLQELKNAGMIKQSGVSVYTNEELATVINDPLIEVIQLPFNLLDNFSQRGVLLAKAKEEGKQIQIRSVFLQGLFFRDPELITGSLQPLKPYLLQLQRIAEENSLSMEALCLQYVNAQENIDEIILGVDTVKQLDSNISNLNISLSKEIGELINRIMVQETRLLYPYNWAH